jgi:hypothetical protein
VSSRAAKKAAFSNARNAASGILLRSRDPAPDSSDAMRTAFLRSRLQFYAYDVVASSSLSEGGGGGGGPARTTTRCRRRRPGNRRFWAMTDSR